MKALAITNKGIEDIAEKELKESIKPKQTQIKETTVIFEPKDIKDLCTFSYTSQSIIKLIYLLDSFEFKDNPLDKLKKDIKNIDIKKLIEKNTTFAARAKIIENNMSTPEIEAETGELIINNLNLKVDLKDPDITFFIYIYKKTCYFGIDFTIKTLSKRDYRIFTSPASLTGSIAYSLIKIADYSRTKTLVDPFSRSGEIPIETALYSSNFPVNHFSKDTIIFPKIIPLKELDKEKFFEKIDKKITDQKTNIFCIDSQLRNIKSAQKNAKIAGINKQITFSKQDIEWLDTKLDKHSVDIIATNPPKPSKRTNTKDLEKTYNELFYQADFILKKQGKIILTAKDKELIEKTAQKNNIKIVSERTVMQGKESFNIILLEKK